MMYIIRKRNKLLLFNVERDMLEGYKEMRERKWVVIYDAELTLEMVVVVVVSLHCPTVLLIDAVVSRTRSGIVDIDVSSSFFSSSSTPSVVHPRMYPCG